MDIFLGESGGEEMINLAVDGSYNGKLTAAGLGYVVTDAESGEVLHKFTGFITDSNYVKSRQVSGELLATVFGVIWCVKNGYKDINIIYDFVGVRNYINLNKLTKQVTLEYQKMMLALFSTMPGRTVNFEKIKSHTGHELNEMADDLAAMYTRNVDKEFKQIREVLLSSYDKIKNAQKIS